MSEAELARDLRAVLERVRQGVEVVIEQGHTPVAVLKPPAVTGRLLSEIVADLKARGSTASIDDDFARDIEAQREPWTPRPSDQSSTF